MSYNDVMNKIRQWDNQFAKKIERLLYVPFLFIFVAIVIAAFINSLKIIDINADLQKGSILERLLMAQTMNTLLLVILFIFNSFLILYIFNNILRLRGILKNIDFNLSHRRTDQRHKEN